MVKPEQVSQRLGVAFVLLKLGNESQRSSQQTLVATTEVDKALRHATTATGLVNGQIHRGVLHSVECHRQLAELIIAVHREGGRSGMVGTRTSRVDGGNQRRDLLVGGMAGLPGEIFHRMQQASHHTSAAE